MRGQEAIIVTSIGSLKKEAGFDKETSDETLFGRKLEILKREEDNWFYVETDYGYRGYIHGMSLFMEDDKIDYWDKNARHIVNFNSVDLQKSASYEANRGPILFRGSVVLLTGTSNGDWLEVEIPTGERYWLRREYIAPKVEKRELEEEAFRDSIVEMAKNYMGCHYRWGGKTILGLDCSGLCHLVYLLHGLKIYRDASIEEGYAMREIEADKVKKGDLLYWKGHVAIYMGQGRYIHSTGRSGGVVINSLRPEDPLYREDLAYVEKYGSIFN